MKYETVNRLAEKGALIFMVDPVSPGYLFAWRLTKADVRDSRWFVDLQPYVGLNLEQARHGTGLFGIPLLGREDKYYEMMLPAEDGSSSELATSGRTTHERQARKEVRRFGQKMTPDERHALDKQFKKYIEVCKNL